MKTQNRMKKSDYALVGSTIVVAGYLIWAKMKDPSKEDDDGWFSGWG